MWYSAAGMPIGSRGCPNGLALETTAMPLSAAFGYGKKPGRMNGLPVSCRRAIRVKDVDCEQTSQEPDFSTCPESSVSELDRCERMTQNCSSWTDSRHHAVTHP